MSYSEGKRERISASYAESLQAEHDQTTFTLTTGLQNVFILNTVGLTGMKTVLLHFPAANTGSIAVFGTGRRTFLNAAAVNAATINNTNGFETIKAETELLANTNEKVSIVDSYSWIVVQVKGASGGESYICTFQGI